MRDDKPLLYLLLILPGSIAVRIVLSLISQTIIDVQNYELVADTILTNGVFSLYAQTPGIYPYPPLWVWFEVLAKLVSSAQILSFPLVIRLPIILADTGIVYLIWHWYNREAPSQRVLWATIYALNPVSLIITCLHGQFDAIPTFFSLWAIYSLVQRRNLTMSAVALALAVAFKSYPVLLLAPVLLQLKTVRERLLYFVSVLAPVAVILLPFMLRSPAAVMNELFNYYGVGLLGILVPIRTIYVPLSNAHFPIDLTVQIINASRWIFMSAYLAVLVWVQHQRLHLPETIATTFLLFYTLCAGISPQYLVWVVPFLAISQYPKAIWGCYTFTATLAMLGFYAYAIPELFPFSPKPFSEASKWLYGIFGTLWWLSNAAILIWMLRRKKVLT